MKFARLAAAALGALLAGPALARAPRSREKKRGPFGPLLQDGSIVRYATTIARMRFRIWTTASHSTESSRETFVRRRSS